MKVFNSTLAAIGLAAFVFASCSDSTSDQGKEIPCHHPCRPHPSNSYISGCRQQPCCKLQEQYS